MMSMKASRVYWLHGLTIRSELELDAVLAPEFQRCDWTILRSADHRVDDQPPNGRVLLNRRFASGLGYTLVEVEDCQVFRFFSTCDFQINHSDRTIRCSLDPRSNAGIASLLIAGTLMASLLIISGECVLHASAVEWDERALAFLGNSGTGKSTLAAICCETGAALVTDDALRVIQQENLAWCCPGTTDIRLRSNSSFLADRFPEAMVRSTVDLRTAVRRAVGASRIPLRGGVIPRPSRTVQNLRVTRITPGKAILYLHAYARSIGWCDPQMIKQQFEDLTRLAKCLPLFEAEIPWGPPFPANLASSLRALVERLSDKQ